MFRMQIHVASKTLKQKEEETENHPHNEADKKIQKHRLKTWDDKTSAQIEQQHSRATENDVHWMTVHGGKEK